MNKKRIRRLMRLMGLMPIYQKPNTSKAAKGRKIYPYLLHRLHVGRPNQAWCADITYLPPLGRLLCNRLPGNGCDGAFCIWLRSWIGTPEIMNIDQGSEFTSFVWTDRLKQAGVKISVDGKGRFLDNIFIERLWRSVRYECVYLHTWESGSEAKAGIKEWMKFYNQKRPHSALGGKPPAVVYWQRNETNQPDQQLQKVA